MTTTMTTAGPTLLQIRHMRGWELSTCREAVFAFHIDGQPVWVRRRPDGTPLAMALGTGTTTWLLNDGTIHYVEATEMTTVVLDVELLTAINKEAVRRRRDEQQAAIDAQEKAQRREELEAEHQAYELEARRRWSRRRRRLAALCLLAGIVEAVNVGTRWFANRLALTMLGPHAHGAAARLQSLEINTSFHVIPTGLAIGMCCAFLVYAWLVRPGQT